METRKLRLWRQSAPEDVLIGEFLGYYRESFEKTVDGHVPALDAECKECRVGQILDTLNGRIAVFRQYIKSHEDHIPTDITIHFHDDYPGGSAVIDAWSVVGDGKQDGCHVTDFADREPAADEIFEFSGLLPQSAQVSPQSNQRILARSAKSWADLTPEEQLTVVELWGIENQDSAKESALIGGEPWDALAPEVRIGRYHVTKSIGQVVDRGAREILVGSCIEDAFLQFQELERERVELDKCPDAIKHGQLMAMRKEWDSTLDALQKYFSEEGNSSLLDPETKTVNLDRLQKQSILAFVEQQKRGPVEESYMRKLEAIHEDVQKLTQNPADIGKIQSDVARMLPHVIGIPLLQDELKEARTDPEAHALGIQRRIAEIMTPAEQRIWIAVRDAGSQKGALEPLCKDGLPMSAATLSRRVKVIDEKLKKNGLSPCSSSGPAVHFKKTGGYANSKGEVVPEELSLVEQDWAKDPIERDTTIKSYLLAGPEDQEHFRQTKPGIEDEAEQYKKRNPMKSD